MNVTVPLVEAPCLTLSVWDLSVLLTGYLDACAPPLDGVSGGTANCKDASESVDSS